MKRHHYSLVLFFFSTALMAPPSQEVVTYNMNYNPVKEARDDYTVAASCFNILGLFGQILLDPHNKESVVKNVTGMVENIANIAQTVTRSTSQERKARNQELQELVRNYLTFLENNPEELLPYEDVLKSMECVE